MISDESLQAPATATATAKAAIKSGRFMRNEKERMRAVINEQASYIKRLQYDIAELIKIKQKLYKKIDELHPANADRVDINCECESSKTIVNRSGPKGKDLCTDCAGWA